MAEIQTTGNHLSAQNLTLQRNSPGKHQAFTLPKKTTGTTGLSRCTPQGLSLNFYS